MVVRVPHGLPSLLESGGQVHVSAPNRCHGGRSSGDQHVWTLHEPKKTYQRLHQTVSRQNPAIEPARWCWA